MSTKQYEHPSYGIVTINRNSSSHKKSLYGSNMKHNHTICLRIKKSYKQRDINHDWYIPDETLMEIEMTPSQWAELMSAIDLGHGVPCTIRYDHGESYEYPPEETQREIFQAEFEKDIKKSLESMQTAISRWHELATKKTITKAEREEISNLLASIQRTMTDSIPFIQTEFDDCITKTIEDAKMELETWQLNMLHMTQIQQICNLEENISKPIPEFKIKTENGSLYSRIAQLESILTNQTGELPIEDIVTLENELHTLTEIEKIWDSFKQIPINPITQGIEKEWNNFKQGTHYKIIHQWFEQIWHVSVIEKNNQ